MIYLYWLLPVPILGLMVVLMYHRKQHRSYPIFWGFLCFQCVRLVSEALCYHISWKAYFYAYWTASAFDVVLSLLLLRSIFRTLIRLYSLTTHLRITVFEAALACFWSIGVFIACQSTAAHKPVLTIITRVGQATSVAEVGMFTFVVISAAILGVKWSETVCGVAAGLGLLGSADLFFYAALAQDRVTKTTADNVQNAAYFLAVAIFAFYFVPRPAEKSVEATAAPKLLEWAEAMRRTVSR